MNISSISLMFGASMNYESIYKPRKLVVPRGGGLLRYLHEPMIALVASPGGRLHLVDFTSHQAHWSFASGGPIYAAHHAPNVDYIDCGRNEPMELYIHKSNSEPEVLPYSSEKFIRKKLKSSNDADLVLSIKTTMFLIDYQTGTVIDTFESDEGPSPKHTNLDHDEVLRVKRVDYRLTYRSSTTGELMWFLMFADFKAWFPCECNKFLSEIEDDGHKMYCSPHCTVYRARDNHKFETVFRNHNIPMPLLPPPGGDAKVQHVASKKKRSRKSKKSKTNTNLSEEPDTHLISQRTIGKISFSDQEIAKGSNGTVVLEGKYDGLDVAVKRIVKVNHDLAKIETQNLRDCDHHPNIVRYYDKEYGQEYAYLAFERCICTLHELILSIHDSSLQLQPKMEIIKNFKLSERNELLKLIRGIAAGLVYMHKRGTTHGNLNPYNVLISKDIRTLISGMGNSKPPPADMSFLTNGATGYGSFAVDLYNLGRIFLFCISGGRHQFHDTVEGDMKISEDRKDISFVDDDPEAFDLISKLLDPNPKLRPAAAEVYDHHLFWDSHKRLSLLRAISERLEPENLKSELSKDIENIGNVVFDGNWHKKLDTRLKTAMEDYRGYTYNSMRDLLRFIRNPLSHNAKLSMEIHAILGSVPTEFENYFRSRFPKLVMEVYKVVKQHCGEETIFQEYFKPSQL